MSDELVTLPNVTLISVGAWRAGGKSPGQSKDVVFTEQDLRDIIASMEAPDVKEPRMVLGHTASSDPAGMSDMADEGFFGEQPAIGKFVNCHLSADNQDIIGDLVGVPSWLAKILPTAYPNRSVEVYWDVPSGIPGAPNHACLMPRVALLGTNLPAVATLEDLRVFFSEDGPELTEPDLAKATRRIAASRGESMPQRAAASVQFEDVRREFYNDFATEQSGRYWWWITAVYVDPATLIVDDDEESLWSVPYTIDGDDIKFGEPVKIKVQYVEEDSGKVAASRAEASSSTERQYAKAASRPNDRNKPRKEQASMAIDIGALRERMGLTAEQLPDDATEDQINAALSAPPAPAGEPAGGGEPAAVPGEGDEPAAPPAPEAGAATAAASQVGPTVTVDRTAWEASQRDTAALKADLESRNAKEREGRVTAAIKAGKIPPSRKEHYVKLMEADPEGTTSLLDSLETVLPVGAESGVSETGDVASATAMSEYPLDWLNPSERARAEAARAGAAQTARIVSEA